MSFLQAKQVTTGYGNRKISEYLDCSFVEGSFTSIIGPNGCGKSTLLKTLARILSPEAGEVYLDERVLKSYSTKEIAKKLAVLSQKPETAIELSVFDLVSFGRYPYQSGWKSVTKEDENYIQWALDLTDLTDLSRESVALLSGGQRQRVWLAMALVQNTDILILDEPTTYLDPAHQLEVLNVLKKINLEYGKTIIMTIHDINLAARFSDSIIAMKDGKVVKEGQPNKVITPELLSEVFLIDAEIIFHKKTNRPVVLSYNVIDKEKVNERTK